MSASSQLSADAACFIPSGQLFTKQSNNAGSSSFSISKTENVNSQSQRLYQPSNDSTYRWDYNHETYSSGHGRGRVRVKAPVMQQNSQAYTAVPVWMGSSYSFPSQPVHVGSVAVPIFPSTIPIPALPNQSTKQSALQQHQSKLLVAVGSCSSSLETMENRMPLSNDNGPAESCPSDENDVVRAAVPKAKKKKRKRKPITREQNSESQTIEPDAVSMQRALYVNNECQTDFPVQLARMSLSELPNSFYKKTAVEVDEVELKVSPFSTYDCQLNRQDRSSSREPVGDLFKVGETTTLNTELMSGSEANIRTVPSAKSDSSDGKSSVPPPVRLWSCLINPGDKFTKVNREKNLVTASVSQKSSNVDEETRSVTPSQNKSRTARGAVDSPRGSDSRPTASKPRLLTPSRDRTNNKSASAADLITNSNKKQLKSAPKDGSDNVKSSPNPRVLIAGKKVAVEKNSTVRRESRGTSQGRPSHDSLKNKDENSTEQAQNLSHRSIDISQSEPGKRKRRKKKSTALSVDVVPDPVMVLHSVATPHLDDFGEFPTLPISESRVDVGWDLSSRYRTTSSVSQVLAVSDECNNTKEQAEHRMSSVQTNAAGAGNIERKAPDSTRQPRHPVPSGKKFNQPIMFSLFDVLDMKSSKEEKDKKSQRGSKNTITYGKNPYANVKHVVDDSKLHRGQTAAPKVVQKVKGSTRVSNKVSASAPVKRGKEREQPKARKPTMTRKIILGERESRRQKFLQDMMLGNFSSGLSRYMPPAWLASATDSQADVPCSENRSNEAEKKALLLSKIHSRRFREYCSQMLTPEINGCCVQLLQELVRFQDRLYHKDPVKAKMKRRIVLGLREVAKHLKSGKIKCIIVSPNLERVQSKGGLDESLYCIITECQQQGVPCIFALSRKALGKACAKHVPVSIVGIFNYEGAEEHYNILRSLADRARQDYADIVSKTERELANFDDDDSRRQTEIDEGSDLDPSFADEYTEHDQFSRRLQRLRLASASSASSVRSTADSEPAACRADEGWLDMEAAGSRAYHSEGELSQRHLSDDDEGDDSDDEDMFSEAEVGSRIRRVSLEKSDAEKRTAVDRASREGTGTAESSVDYISKLLSSNFRQFGQATSSTCGRSSAVVFDGRPGDVAGDSLKSVD